MIHNKMKLNRDYKDCKLSWIAVKTIFRPFLLTQLFCSKAHIFLSLQQNKQDEKRKLEPN